jgi:hypothetical protein
MFGEYRTTTFHKGEEVIMRTTVLTRRVLRTIGLTLGFCALTSAAFAQKYTVRELKPHGNGWESSANAINVNGTIVGAADDGSYRWGTWWDIFNGSSPLGAVGAGNQYTFWTTINTPGDVAGFTGNNGAFDNTPVMVHNNNLIVLPKTDFFQGEAHSVADYLKDGYYAVAGRLFQSDSNPTMKSRAVLWNNNGDMALLPTLPGGAGIAGNAARSISNLGNVGGSSAWSGSQHEQAVVWGAFSLGMTMWLNDPNAAITNKGVGGCVNDVRDNKYFAGYIYPFDGANKVACYWPNFSECVPIGDQSKGFSMALAVRNSKFTKNGRPEIVGMAEDPYAPSYHQGFSYAFRWNPSSGWKNLNDLIVTEHNWKLMVARDIDREGRIVGWGTLNGQFRGFLLTPLVISVWVPPYHLKSLMSGEAKMEIMDTAPTDIVVSVRASNSAVRVPSTVTIRRGQKGVSFPIYANRVSESTKVTVTVELDGETTDAQMTVIP